MVVVVAELWPFLNILPDFFHERRRGGGVRKVVGKASISKCVCVHCVSRIANPHPLMKKNSRVNQV